MFLVVEDYSIRQTFFAIQKSLVMALRLEARSVFHLCPGPRIVSTHPVADRGGCYEARIYGMTSYTCNVLVGGGLPLLVVRLHVVTAETEAGIASQNVECTIIAERGEGHDAHESDGPSPAVAKSTI